MIFPTNDEALARRVRWLVDRCLSSRGDRDQRYQWRERWYLYGCDGYEQARVNKIESHLDLVTSFLYAPDHAFYHISPPPDVDEIGLLKCQELGDDFNEDFISAGISDAIMESIPWSLVYDTVIPKMGWNRDTSEMFIELVPPHNFGVYNEAVSDLDSQEAFCHSYFIDYQKAAGKLMLAGLHDRIDQMEVVRTSSISPFPEMINRMMVSSSTGASLSGTLFGQVNPDYAPNNTYQPQTEIPMVRWNELWAWDDTYLDWRIFHMIEPDILVGDSVRTIAAYKKATQNVIDFFGKLEKMGVKRSDSNLFFPGEHAFAKIQPYKKWNYFWGKAHIDSLIPLQSWLLERIDQIDDILDRQADPPGVGSGFLGISEEKISQFGGAGTRMFDQLPQAKYQEFAPDMPPDVFAEYKEIKLEFLEASGLTEVMSGRSEQGVRSRQHASELKKSGSGRIKKAAMAIESPLVKIGDIGLKLKMAHDNSKLRTAPDEQEKTHDFLPCEVGDVKIRVDGHSHSPLFGDESREMALTLRKFGAIDDEDLIRMSNPPSRDMLLHRLRQRRRAAKKMAREHPEIAAAQAAKGKGHKR